MNSPWSVVSCILHLNDEQRTTDNGQQTIMNTIGKHSVASALQLAGNVPSQKGLGLAQSSDLSSVGKEKNGELRDKFTQFVGEAFYGQMLKSMRATVGKPAYFYGGHAEEVFQGQLDQTMAEQLTKQTASKFADPMFERQFPQLAEAKTSSGMNDLSQLRRQ